MKILIAIPSCRLHAATQQAQRDTWVQDVPAGVDLRFVMGEPDGICGDEVYLGEDAFSPSQGLKKYPTLPNKIKLICKWALESDYDFGFKTDTDTLVNVKNLLSSGFEDNDYSGGYNHEETGEFASGGAGYWLSRKAMKFVADTTIASWAEDVFVALALKERGILPVWNSGYRWKPGATMDKDMITLHLGSALHPEPYVPERMYEYYKKMKAHDYL